MSEILKKPYKITLWEDRNVYITRQSQKGDVNFDGTINRKDWHRLGRYLNDGDVEIDKWAADIDNNNIIDNSDLSLIDSDEERQELINNPTLKPSERKSVLSEDDLVQNQFFEEVCIATIGSDSMDTPIRAFNPILTEELNGSKTFTFQIYYRYWDDEDEKFKLNPFIDLLVNERKVKLKYDDNWYDFVIKGIQEDSENYTFTYTCSDLFINELGKTGYEVELDTELQNNMGTVKELANYILEGTDWSEYNSETLIQRNKEALYIYRTSENNTLTAVDMLDSTHTLSANQLKDKAIYIFYSCKANNESQPQFLYVEGNPSTVDEAKEIYKIDKDGFITNSSNWLLIGSINYDDLIPSQYFGQKIIQKQRAKYIPQIGETCTVWEDENDNQYYCYTELEYASVSEIQNMLVNSTSFITPDGWTVGDNSSINVETCTVSDGHGSSTTHHSLRVQGTAKNRGFFDNKTSLAPSGIIAGEPYIVALRAAIYDENEDNNVINNNKITSPLVYGVSNTNTSQTNNLITFDDNESMNGTGILSGYKIFKGSAVVSKSYQEIINNFSQLLFQFQTTITNGISDIVNLLDIKLFKERHDKNGNLIVPDLEESYSKIPQEDISEGTIPAEEGWYEYDSTNGYTPTEDTSPQPNTDYYSIYNSIIKTRYNFFSTDTDLSNVYSKESLALSDTFLLEEGTTLEDHGYNPVLVENYEKVTSITGSKSNRFNLIQSLCEAFECWAKFTIEHDSKGRILYEYIPINQDEYIVGGRYYQRIDGNSGVSSDDSKFSIYTGNSYINGLYKKVYHKYVTFKEFIGQENPIGFRYGINLKSIQRDIVSDQIASKVIVQPNTNEFAPNGSCTIQQALLNPTGENALYNFQYFINHGLLDTVALYDDLYGTNGGLGFFVKMREYNDQIREPINELGLISNTINRLASRQIVYDALAEEADNLKTSVSAELSANGYGISGGSNIPDYISSLRKNYESYQSTKNYYSSISASNKSLLENYQARYNAINSSLSEILVKKNKLNSDFHKKYYSFIQEGTWTSNEYFDPELYYQAANMVLYTSSFPQVSYTINVLELSQVEGFEPYKFKIADKTYVEDVEFFGYDYKNRPYKEEIVISEIRINLDDPSQNTITVQNYKTQFQDLFQRIAATSQSLQYNEGAYNRAASAINDDGTINSALLQNSLRDNELIIQNAKNQSVNWDETGITISNFVNANEIVRLTSGGIVLSSDGGQSWTTGITGTGINADVITTGRLDTNRIRIFNNNMQTFEWNSKGINAFAQTTTDNVTQTDFSKFVRFDQYGLYGYSGSANWDPNVETNGVIGISKVIRDSIFSLTWKGLSINIPPDSQSDPVITIGPSNNPTFQVDEDGNVTMAGSITLAGNITWSDNNKPTSEPLKLYSEVALENPSGNITYPSTDTNGTYDIKRYSTSTSIYDWYANGSIISNKYKVYESNNKGISSSYAVAKIVFEGYTEFKIRIRSYAEGSYDYTIASTLDAPTYPTAYNSTYNSSSIVKASTRGNQSSTTYTSVTYNSSDGVTTGSHFIYIVFRKNNSGDSNNDAGYFYIEVEQQKTWHTTYNSTKDKYVAYSYDNGATWTTSNAITVDNDTVYNALINDNGKLGLFHDSTRGLCINADYIKTGALNADNVTITNLNASNITAGTLNVDRIAAKTITGAKLEDLTIEDGKIAYQTIKNNSIADDAITARTIKANTITANEIDTGYIDIIVGDSSYGGISVAWGYDGIDRTKGIKMYGSDSDYYVIATNEGVRMTADESHSIYVTSSGCYADGSAITSDRNLKDNINYDLSQYEPFMKEIKPCSFTFKTEPNKISFGFIAQDIESLLLKNNFNKDNFSILNILKTKNGDKYFLSYNDFIALQQWQIQKLESRISVLENLISS